MSMEDKIAIVCGIVFLIFAFLLYLVLRWRKSVQDREKEKLKKDL